LPTIDEFLGPTETIAWRGRPVKKTVLLQSFAGVPFALIFGGVGMVMLYLGESLLGLPLAALAVACCLVVIPPVWFLKQLPNTEYAVTNRRLLIKTGPTKYNVWATEIGQIRGIIVKTGVSDRLFGTGKLYPITPEYPYAPKLRAYTRGGTNRLRKVYNLVTETYDEISEIELYRKSLSHPHLEGLENPEAAQRFIGQAIGAETVLKEPPIRVRYSTAHKIGLAAGTSLVIAALAVYAWGYFTGYTPYVSYQNGYTFIDQVGLLGFGTGFLGALILFLTSVSLLHSRWGIGRRTQRRYL
jgi:hypothetical protein